MAVRAPHLLQPCAASASAPLPSSAARSSEGAEIPFAFEEHDVAAAGRRSTSTGRSSAASSRPAADARWRAATRAIALEALGREPAAAIFARAHARRPVAETRALPHRPAAARRRRRRGLRRLRLGRRRLRPRLRDAREIALRRGARLRGGRAARRPRGWDAGRARAAGSACVTAAAGELAAHWPEAAGPPAARTSAASPTGCACSSSSARCRRGRRSRPTRRARSQTRSPRSGWRPPAPIAAGPVLFERLDWRPFGVRPVLPIAATQPPGEPTRLDVSSAAGSRATCSTGSPPPTRIASSARRSTAGSSSLFQDGPFRAEQLRSSLEALLGGGDGIWAAASATAVLLGETGAERADLPRGYAAWAKAVADADAAISCGARSSRRSCAGTGRSS